MFEINYKSTIELKNIGLTTFFKGVSAKLFTSTEKNRK
jgi:hypothetical protein